MTEPPDRLIPDTLDFMSRLAANNRRDWFQQHKAQYEAEVKHPAGQLLETLRARLAAMTGETVTPKLYRIHRDLRFSKDKTPYNTHLHLQWSGETPGAWLFGISRDYVCAGMGVMALKGTALANWREAVAGAKGEELATMLAGFTGSGYRFDPPALKRVPSPHAQDHPRADLLRRKGLVLWKDLSDGEQGDPSAALSEIFTAMEPLRKLLGAIIA